MRKIYSVIAILTMVVIAFSFNTSSNDDDQVTPGNYKFTFDDNTEECIDQFYDAALDVCFTNSSTEEEFINCALAIPGMSSVINGRIVKHLWYNCNPALICENPCWIHPPMTCDACDPCVNQPHW